MMYKYEMHCHTAESSKCGKSTSFEQLDFFKSLGFTGVCFADHFFNGNTAFDKKTLSYETMVEMLYENFDKAKDYADKIGIDLFIGWEFSHRGTDFLVYGLDKDWLLAHPDCHKTDINELLTTVRESGGYIVQAHPFREASYIKAIRLFPRIVDAIEVINANRNQFTNNMALQYAENYKLLHFAGSDIHNHLTQKSLASVSISHKANNVSDILKEVLANRHIIKQEFIIRDENGNAIGLK